MSTSATYIVYLVVCAVTGRRYVGVTSRPLPKRMREHFRHARYGANDGHFYRAIRKHGNDAFSAVVIATCGSRARAMAEEKRQILLLDPEYNSTPGGVGRIGRHSEKTKQKMSEAKLRHPIRYWLGKKRDDETKRKISESKKGKKILMTHAALAAVARNCELSAIARRRPIIVDGSIEFSCARLAAEFYGLPHWRSVHKAARGRYSLYGHRFAYKEVV